MKREVNMRYIPKDESRDSKDKQGKENPSRPEMPSGRINTDPLGMWTGVPTGALYEEPVQDADDL